MKKYMIPVVALLFVAGVAGAQTTKKQPSPTPAKKEAAAKKSASAATSGVASTAKTGTDAKSTTVGRKHHHKKTKPVAKTESK